MGGHAGARHAHYSRAQQTGLDRPGAGSEYASAGNRMGRRRRDAGQRRSLACIHRLHRSRSTMTLFIAAHRTHHRGQRPAASGRGLALGRDCRSITNTNRASQRQSIARVRPPSERCSPMHLSCALQLWLHAFALLTERKDSTAQGRQTHRSQAAGGRRAGRGQRRRAEQRARCIRCLVTGVTLEHCPAPITYHIGPPRRLPLSRSRPAAAAAATGA